MDIANSLIFGDDEDIRRCWKASSADIRAVIAHQEPRRIRVSSQVTVVFEYCYVLHATNMLRIDIKIARLDIDAEYVAQFVNDRAQQIVAARRVISAGCDDTWITGAHGPHLQIVRRCGA